MKEIQRFENLIHRIIDNVYNQGYENGLGKAQTDSYVKGYEDGQKEKLANAMIFDHEVAEKKAYEDGMNAAWEAVSRIIEPVHDGGYDFDALHEIFGEAEFRSIFKHNTASEAIAKIKEYEDKQDAEIKVGDEIRLHDAIEVVTSVMSTGLQTIGASGNTSTWYYDTYPLETWKKTGRHFDEIKNVLDKMGEVDG